MSIESRLKALENTPLQKALAETRALMLKADKCIMRCARYWSDGELLDMYYGRQAKPENNPLWDQYHDAYSQLLQAIEDNHQALSVNEFKQYADTLRKWVTSEWIVDNEH